MLPQINNHTWKTKVKTASASTSNSQKEKILIFIDMIMTSWKSYFASLLISGVISVLCF